MDLVDFLIIAVPCALIIFIILRLIEINKKIDSLYSQVQLMNELNKKEFRRLEQEVEDERDAVHDMYQKDEE
tara:strand:- start:308 stop:523 length:216 start_codon:yes stop_codon:yes gene_type:complete